MVFRLNKRESGNDPRRYNIPKIGEIAVVFDGENGEPNVSDFMVQPKTNNNSFITSVLHPLSQNCDPMVYPLIFFHGEPGWRPGIEHTSKTNTKTKTNTYLILKFFYFSGAKRFQLTMLQFYSARLAYRPLEKDFSPLLYSGKLLHQYIVDAYVKVESNRINWVKTHQSVLHVEQYRGLIDYVRSNTGVGAIGRVTILPSTFQVN